MQSTMFQLGDSVIHAAKPEWGTGSVLSAKADTEQGSGAQKLQVRFQHGGMKTLSTAFATLRHVSNGDGAGGAGGAASPSGMNGSGGSRLEGDADPVSVMGALPSEATDPFATPAKRLEETLGLYRFTGEGASLIEWATLQSGLADPLTRFSRHDLEEFFHRYATHRDRHLAKVRRENLKTDPKTLSSIVQAAPPAAREALRRITQRS